MKVLHLIPPKILMLTKKTKQPVKVHKNKPTSEYSTNDIKTVLIEEVEDIKWVLKTLDVRIFKK